MATGRIKFFDKEQGFGIIKPNKPGPDAYVLRSALEAARISRHQAEPAGFYQLEEQGARGEFRYYISKRVTVKGGLSASRKDSCFGRSIQH